MLALIGLCRGFHSNTRTVGENTFVDNVVLVEVEQPNQYGLNETKTIAVKLSKKQMESGYNNMWNQFKEKQVSVPVFVSAWASRAGHAGFDYWLSGEGKPLNLQLAATQQKTA
ncbi:hypothetical protein DN824_22090 [Stutzerimonas nosocomialis]|uniref:DNA-binding protein n=1 Tax=Stutzerimonas nosocomialis TaxID=1056496 RepID=UPI001108BBE4|nr:DNA-binding protein [Stutzerimonas nosocomialis]TLX52750.1 hypothetical protein DN824_22090 [Stutzerimonas nosocomialis]